MKAKKIIRIAAAVLVAAVIGGCIYLDTLLPIITGYAAKNLASAVFVSGRNPSDVEALDLNFSFIKYTSNKVDTQERTVTSRFLWRKSVAQYRDGYGVTLLRGKKSLPEDFPLELETSFPETLEPGDSALCAALEPIAKAFVDDKAYNGHPFAFVVLHKGGIVAERYGEGISASTRLLSWSMGKSFTNALAGIMAGDGLVDIYAPLPIPEWQNDGRKAITLNDLMQMQSGLQWNENYGNRSDVNIMLHCEQDMGLFAQSKPLEYEPGTHWYYSSGSTNIVMRYLRSLFSSDAEFLAYIRERLFAPLGINGACFEPDMSGTPVGSSYLYVTARDYARFAQMFLDDGVVGRCCCGEADCCKHGGECCGKADCCKHGGECCCGKAACSDEHASCCKRILPEGWVAYTTTPASDSKGGYGAFFWLNQGGVCPDVPSDMYSCNGHDGQQIYIVPSKDLAVVILSYSPKPDHVIDFNSLLRDIIAQLQEY